MKTLLTSQIALVLGLAAIVATGCGSSSSSSAVRQGNTPVKLAFNDPGYPAACEKSLETADSKGNAFNADQAKTFCGCLRQQARSGGLSSQSEDSITNDQFRSLFSTCQAQLGTTTSGTTT